MVFHPILHSIASEESVQHSCYPAESLFRDQYENYQKIRRLMYDAQFKGSEMRDSLFTRALSYKGSLAKTVMSAYVNACSTEEAVRAIDKMIGFGLSAHTRYRVAGAHVYPLSCESVTYSSPVESIDSTIKNLQVVAEFRDIVSKRAEAILLSGANAWGPFYAVSGGIPKSLVEYGFVQKGFRQFSDIDLLVSCNSVEDFQAVIEDLVQAGLLVEDEIYRYSLFRQLYDDKRVDMFSVRAHYNDVEESIHFVPMHILKDISKMRNPRASLVNGRTIGIVKDFRSNVPGNVQKHGGYPTGSLHGRDMVLVQPEIEKVDYKDLRRDVGYISDLTVGGPDCIAGNTYYVGVLTFFLLVTPSIVYDKTGQLWLITQQLRRNVIDIMGKNRPVYIPRQERMQPEVLFNVINSLYEHD